MKELYLNQGLVVLTWRCVDQACPECCCFCEVGWHKNPSNLRNLELMLILDLGYFLQTHPGYFLLDYFGLGLGHFLLTHHGHFLLRYLELVGHGHFLQTHPGYFLMKHPGYFLLRHLGRD